MPLVSLTRQNDYALPALRVAVGELLAPLGGMKRFVKAGDRVVLKLNLVCPTRGNLVAYTQAEIFQVVAEMVLDCGGKVVAGDSPGAGSAAKVAKIAGIAPLAEALGVPIIEFTGKEIFSARRVFRQLTLARELLEADAVVNLPRLKTHGQMMLTAAVKNLFGAVIGTEKFAWHYRAGADYAMFARMLYEIERAVAPRLTILDAIVAMDGNGPTAGSAQPLGFLAAGEDSTAIDATMMKILGRAPEDLYTVQAATAAGDTAWQNVELRGVENLADLKPTRWRWSPTQTLAMIPPRLWRYLPFVTEEKFRRWTALYPQIVAGKCVRCGKCLTVCSVGALAFNGADVAVNQNKCIRCYCCHELCPHHALELRGGWLSRWLRRLNWLWQKI
ncbi:hypothetical protein AGMMS49959_03820 [Planctomycetales bacterium]|nr:hypothetical protein AGMMS49959_03820 [Planctomycetales bacterium]